MIHACQAVLNGYLVPDGYSAEVALDKLLVLRDGLRWREARPPRGEPCTKHSELFFPPCSWRQCRVHPPPFRLQHRLSDWPDCGLELHCWKGVVLYPVRLLAQRGGDRTFGEVLARLR